MDVFHLPLMCSTGGDLAVTMTRSSAEGPSLGQHIRSSAKIVEHLVDTTSIFTSAVDGYGFILLAALFQYYTARPPDINPINPV